MNHLPLYQKIILFFGRTTIVVMAFFLLGFLWYRDIVASGALETAYDFQNTSPYISPLRPQARVSEPMRDREGVSFQTIKGQPVYFDVRMPRFFQKAKVRVKYKNASQPLFEIGALADKLSWTFDLLPLEHQSLDFLWNASGWSRITSGNLVLFQKEQKFESIESFLQNPPGTEKIAAYRYTLGEKILLPAYKAAKEERDISHTLAGTHRMYTYIKDEALDFRFTLQDTNQEVGQDSASVEVYQGDAKIFSDLLVLDTNGADAGKLSETKEIAIFMPDLSEGVYRIQIISASEDIVIRKIETRQKLLVFIKSVRLADSSLPVTLWTNGQRVYGLTKHKDGLQNIRIGSQELALTATHKKVYVDTPFEMKEVKIPHGDARLETNGWWSFEEESFFRPEAFSLSDGLMFDTDTIDFVIASYRPADTQGDWRVAEATFDVSRLWRQDNNLYFVFSLPLFEEGQAGIDIAEISARLEGNPLTVSDIFKKLRKLFLM